MLSCAHYNIISHILLINCWTREKDPLSCPLSLSLVLSLISFVLAGWVRFDPRWRRNSSGGGGRSGSWRRRAAPPPPRPRPRRWRKPRRWELKKFAAIVPKKGSPARSGPRSRSWSELSPGALQIDPPPSALPTPSPNSPREVCSKLLFP